MNTTSVGMSMNQRKRVPHLASTTSILHLSIASSKAKGKLGKNTLVLQGTKGCRLKHKFRQQWTIVSLLSILSSCLQCTKGFLIYIFKGVMKGQIRVISRHMEGQESSESRKTPKGFGFCTHPDVCSFMGQTNVYM